MEDSVYVITGATSFIGSGLIKKLVKENKKIYAVCRNNTKNIGRIPDSDLITIVYCDLSKLLTLSDCIKEKCDVFYHLGWSTSEKDNMYLQNANVTYTLDAVNVAKKLGCHTFIGAGSQAEYGVANIPLEEKTPTFPVTGYGMAKLCAGQMSKKVCEQLNIKHIWTRILSVYGKNDNPNTLIMYLIDTLKKGETPILTDCEQIWDYIHIDDCAEILYKLSYLGDTGRTYVIGSGIEKKLKDYVNIIKVVYAKDIEIVFGGKEKSLQTPSYLLAKSGYCGGMVENPILFDERSIERLIGGASL